MILSKDGMEKEEEAEEKEEEEGVFKASYE